MEEEKKFEKKSTKKIAIIVAIVVVLLVALVGGLLFLNNRNKPEKIFETAVEDMFEMTENDGEEIRSERITLELSADVETDMAEIKAIAPMIKAVKINSVTEIDLDKKIFNQNLSATYDNEEVINVDGLIQNEKIYVYLNELYSKYIDVTNALEDELGMELDLTTMFESALKPVNEDLIKDIQEIIIEQINSSKPEQEEVELNGNKVKKSTMKLSAKDVTTLSKDILEKINEYENNAEIASMAQDLEEAIDSDYYEDEDVLEISLYTKGFKNEIVKLEIDIIEYDEAIMKIEYNEESEERATLTMVIDGQLLGAIIEKEDEDNTAITVVFNEEEAELDNATEMFEIVINETSENKGTITFNMDLGKIMTELALNDEKIKLKIALNLKYKIEENAKIEERNTSNSIELDEFTEEDFEKIYTNIEKNDILMSIMEFIMK